ncbi:hypothetical protein P9112_002812 [Eukaryota sp. TZLM1-RC]
MKQQAWYSFPLYDRHHERLSNADTASVRRLLAGARRKAIESRRKATASSLGTIAVERVRRKRILKQLVNRVSTDSKSVWRSEFARRRRQQFLEQKIMKARSFSTMGNAVLGANSKLKQSKVQPKPCSYSFVVNVNPAKRSPPISLDLRLSKRKGKLCLGHILRQQNRAFIRRRIHLLNVKKSALVSNNRVSKVQLQRQMVKKRAPRRSVAFFI